MSSIMSKKVYVQFAEMFAKKIADSKDKPDAVVAVWEVINDTCKLFEDDNSSFNKVTFWKYVCQSVEDQIKAQPVN